VAAAADSAAAAACAFPFRGEQPRGTCLLAPSANDQNE